MSNLAKYEPRRQDKALIKEGATAFLPPIKLMSGMSKPVKARPPKAKIGDWFLGQETNLGQETEFIVFEAVPHALLLDDKWKVLEESFSPEDPVFKKIQEMTKVRGQKGASWGFNYLLWSCVAKGFGVYYINKSAKMAAGEFEDRVGLHVSATSWEKQFNTGNTAMIPRLVTINGEPKSLPSEADIAAAVGILRASAPRDAGQSAPEATSDPADAPQAGGRKGRK